MDFNTFFNLLITGVISFIAYTQKEKDARNEKRHDKSEQAIKEIKEDMDRNFITRDEHNRDVNSLEKKIDDIRDILMDIKHDTGKLIGERNAKNG